MPSRIDNELVPLDQVMQQRQNERSIPLKDDDAFELFACEQVLRDRDLSAEEVALGVVGGGNDGAIDGVYVFLGDALLSEDSEVLQDGFSPSKVASGACLSLWLVQAKRDMSFAETAFDKIANSTRRLLSLERATPILLSCTHPRSSRAPGCSARLSRRSQPATCRLRSASPM